MKFETKKYILKYPVQIEVVVDKTKNTEIKDVSVKSVTISAPKGKHMREIVHLIRRVEANDQNYSKEDMTLDAIQLISDLPPGGINELHVVDINSIAELVMPFLEMTLGGNLPSQTLPDGTASTKSK